MRRLLRGSGRKFARYNGIALYLPMMILTITTSWYLLLMVVIYKKDVTHVYRYHTGRNNVRQNKTKPCANYVTENRELPLRQPPGPSVTTKLASWHLSVSMMRYNMHYNNATMNAMASQPPASRSFIQSFVQTQIKETSKLRVTGLCEGNSPVIGEFPAQRPVTRKMFPFDDVIMITSFL